MPMPRPWAGAGAPLGAALVAAALPAGCAAPPGGAPADERCQLVAWYRPDKALAEAADLTPAEAKRPELIGSWDGWRRPGLRGWERRQSAEGVEWYVHRLPLPPGVYHYAVVAGDRLFLDARNPQGAFQPSPLLVGDGPFAAEVSRAVVPDCLAPAIAVRGATSRAGALEVSAALLSGADPLGPVDPATLAVTLARGAERLPPPEVHLRAEPEPVVTVSARLPPGKYTVTLAVRDRAGRAAEARASVLVEPDGRPAPAPLADGLVYHLIVDRFRGPGGAPLRPPATPGARAGGTLDGVQAAVEAGYFDRLGVTTLWLSPVYENPPGIWIGRDGRRYEAYHGYWPAAPRAVEPRLGGEAALERLVSAAHARGLRVILDAVPNHVHEAHPYYRERSRQADAVRSAAEPGRASWFNDGPAACVCGGPGCGWGERLEDCWFDRYLPDLNWRHPEVLDAGTTDLLWWTARFDLDGFRIDAVPMMPRAATRRMVRALRDQVFRQGVDHLLLGETYTVPGDFGRAEIRAFLGRGWDGLDSQFDFPLMWSLREVVAHGRRGFPALEEEIAASDRAFAGAGGAIAHILGNHDTTRFVSEAAGDAGGDPHSAPPPQPTGEEPYRRHLLGLTLLFTLPGLPVLYYGDEVALAGGGDPDSRRVLPDPAALPPRQAEVLAQAGRLGRLRRCLPALRRGLRRPLLLTTDQVVALHAPPPEDPAGGPALVLLSRAPKFTRLRVPDVPPGRYRDALSPATVTAPGGVVEIDAPPLSAAVYIPQESPCHESP